MVVQQFLKGLLVASIAVISSHAVFAQSPAVAETPAATVDPILQAQKEALGAVIFHDTALSQPPGQSCATCHQASAAFADPNQVASEGVMKGRFGPRNTPSLSYAKFSPVFGKEEWGVDWMGGQFWDGRALDLKEQALGPLLNPLEMNNTLEGVAKALRASAYWPQLLAVYGDAALKADDALAAAAGDALEAFQRTELFAPFDSKWDYANAGIIELTEQEQLGARIYSGKGMCIDCHAGSEGRFQLYTRFKLHNIWVPRNPALPFYRQSKEANPDAEQYVDLGAGLNTRIPTEEREALRGAFKTPTLRNVAVTAPYMHNGVFKSLDEVIDFYMDIAKFAPPEVSAPKSRMLSMLVLIDDAEKQALIAFLKTLTDGYPATAEQKAKLKALYVSWREQ